VPGSKNKGTTGVSSLRGPSFYHYRRILACNGKAIILWDIDSYYALSSISSSHWNPERTAAYVINELCGGSIILLHFISTDIEALPAIINGIRRKGYQPVTLTELLFSSQREFVQEQMPLGADSFYR
jgi:peptidoglycan/xylan/chitin deacetylase (PgdA/CDA1 family)